MSGSVFLNNLDDFIAPSQACVNPTVAAKLAPTSKAIPTSSGSGKPGKVTLMADYSTTDYEDYVKPVVQPDLIKTKAAATGDQAVATVSLNDCLACSGCVTSAEAVLIAEQSNQKFLSKLQNLSHSNEIVIVQLSPNSRSSLADFLGISPIEVFILVSAALKSRGVSYVVDAASGADVFLMETRAEFLRRYEQGRSKTWVTPTVTTANSSTSVNIYHASAPAGRLPTEQTIPQPALNSSLPVFTSHCPGWVCYAEKTAPQVLPYLSTVKSAQQIVGALMKAILIQGTSPLISSSVNYDALASLSGAELSLSSINKTVFTAATPSVFVVSIQPCFDKKLEASRRDFYHSNNDTVEVDLVLSTTELWEILVQFAQEHHSTASSAAANASASAAISGDKMDVDLDASETTAPTSSSTSSLLLQQRQRLRSHYQYVMQYLQEMQLQRQETVAGCDALESLFRQGSIQATRLLSAAERNAGSGAVAEYLFRYVAEHVYRINLWHEKDLQYKAGRNVDYMELDISTYLSSSSSAPAAASSSRPLKFARAYGFRNIQSLLLKMKRGQLDVDLIEMMACPSGCNNGGGQLKNFGQWIAQAEAVAAAAVAETTSSSSSSAGAKALPETISEGKERVVNVEQVFHQWLALQQPEDNPLVQYIYAAERLQGPQSDRAIALLHTRFHAVPKLETIAPLAAKW